MYQITQLTRAIFALTILLSAVGCGRSADTASAANGSGKKDALTIVAIDNPAVVGSASPGLTVSPSGTVYLSWQERNPDSTLVLRYVTRGATDKTWSAVHDVNTGRNMLASATDVPSVHELPNGGLVAVWRGSHGEAGYDIVMAHSEDQGGTWSAPKAPHSDVTPTEHGFVSWLQLGDSTGMVFLDGRLNADKDKAKHATQLTVAMFDKMNNTGKEFVIDPLICDCCHTSSAVVPGGAVVVYRNRTEGEIRDISVIRIADNKWRAPVSVHDDNWNISGCPVNGPSVSAIGENVAVAWFTAANDSARVRVAFSSDTTNTFGAPIEVNEGFPDGKVGVVLKNSNEAIVSWIERRDKMAVLRARVIHRDGTRGAVQDVADLGEDKRAGGAPKLVKAGGKILIAWTDATTHKVQSAEIGTP